MDSQLENSFRSRYGIEKLRDHNYQNWSFQCRMLLQEKRVWKVVNGDEPRPKLIEQAQAELPADKELSDAQRKKILKELEDWTEKDQDALRIICFTVSDQLQGPIRYRKTAKYTWDELQQVHAPNDRQRKFSLLKLLYCLDMNPNGSLIHHE